MGNKRALSGRKMTLLSAISLVAGVIGTLIGGVMGTVLETSPAWVGPAILMGSIALVLIGALLLPTAIREYRAANRGPAS